MISPIVPQGIDTTNATFGQCYYPSEMLKKIIAAVSSLLFILPLFAQQELGLHFMRDNWHANETNPAIIRDKGGVFRLPGLYNGLAFDGPNYKQLITTVNGEPVININSVIDYLDDENVIKDDFTLQTIGFAFSIKKKWLFSFGHSIKYHTFFRYPKKLAQVIYQGNAQFIGENINIGNELQLSGFHSLDMGLAYRAGKLTVGVKAKFMSGFVDLSTDPAHNDVNFYTDPDIYQITLDGDYILNTSNSLDYRSYNDFDVDLNFGTFTTDKFFDGNTGWAFDLGLRYETDKWDLAASAIDISNGITWKSRVTNYIVQDSFLYEGLDFSGALTGGDSPDFGSTLDSIEQIFQPKEAANNYTSNIPHKVYLSALYKANDRVRVGAVYFNENFHNQNSYAIGLHVNFDVAKWFNAGVTYSITEDTYDNLGMSLMLHGKTFQLFGATDNILDIFNPVKGNNFAIRLGGNLFF